MACAPSSTGLPGGGGSRESEEKGPINQEGSAHTHTHACTPPNNSTIPWASEWRAAKWGEKEKEPEVIIVIIYGRIHGQAEDMNHSSYTVSKTSPDTRQSSNHPTWTRGHMRERDVNLFLLRSGRLINSSLALLKSSPLMQPKMQGRELQP